MVRRIGFDPGTQNLAFAVLDDTTLVYATVMRLCRTRATKSDIAYLCVRLMHVLVEAFRPDEVWVEMQMRERMQAVAQSLVAAALAYGVPGTLIHAARWKACVGIACSGDHRENKRRAVQRARVLGYVLSNHNIADAILIALAPRRLN